jgi:predicted F0F1-ATPase subunit
MTDERADQPFLRTETLSGKLAQRLPANSARRRMVNRLSGSAWHVRTDRLVGRSANGLGAMIGLWWDNHHPGAHSWTLMLLTIGLCVGCANAWHWVDQENKAMQDGQEDKHE